MRRNVTTVLLLAAAVLLAPGLAAAGDVKPAQPGVLHFSANLMFWEYVTFGVVFLILGLKVIPLMLKQLAQRQAGIQDALDKADRVRAEAEILLKKHEEMMRSAHLEAQKITEDARTAGREAAVRIQQQAELASKEAKERSAREIELMVKKAQTDLREQAVELALLAGSRVLEQSLNSEDHHRLAREAIAASSAMRN